MKPLPDSPFRVRHSHRESRAIETSDRFVVAQSRFPQIHRAAILGSAAEHMAASRWLIQPFLYSSCGSRMKSRSSTKPGTIGINAPSRTGSNDGCSSINWRHR